MKDKSQISLARLEKLHELLDRLEKKGKTPEDILLDNAEFQRHFRISRRCAYDWRRKGLVKYLLIEKKVYYRLSAVREFLDRQEKGN